MTSLTPAFAKPDPAHRDAGSSGHPCPSPIPALRGVEISIDLRDGDRNGRVEVSSAEMDLVVERVDGEDRVLKMEVKNAGFFPQEAGKKPEIADDDESWRAEAKRWKRSLTSKEKRAQFLHVRKTLKDHGPVSLAVLNVRSGQCFGRTVGADGDPGTGEVVGKACPRMVERRGKPRCGACGCPTTGMSDLRAVIRSPGWGCGEEKMGRYLPMIPIDGHPAEMKPEPPHRDGGSPVRPAAGPSAERQP